MSNYSPAVKRTMYFIGVTTGKSSIMKVFPRWAEHLGLNAVIKGFDFEPHSNPALYRDAVDFIKKDPLSLGALVTTHKLDLVKACNDIFDGFGEYTALLGEASSISKRKNKLWGHAKDPITSGLSLEAIVPDRYWKDTGGEMHLIGAGGSSLALSLYMINKKKSGGDIPSKIIISNRSKPRLIEMESIHKQITTNLHFEYILAPEPENNDRIVASLKPSSIVINATGLGKDRPGSPLTDKVIFPDNGIVWEFNYRGDLIFMDQAMAQKETKNLTIHDGWIYFIHGWTRGISEVFHLVIPTSGPEFDKLSKIAADTRS